MLLAFPRPAGVEGIQELLGGGLSVDAYSPRRTLEEGLSGLEPRKSNQGENLVPLFRDSSSSHLPVPPLRAAVLVETRGIQESVTR